MSKGNVIMFVRPMTTTSMLRALGIRPMCHLPPHSTKGHPRGDEPGRSGSGAVSSGVRHPHDSEPGNLLTSLAAEQH